MFNSKFLCPNTETVNAFSSDWFYENNPLFPLISLILKAIKHFLASESLSRAISVCPYWAKNSEIGSEKFKGFSIAFLLDIVTKELR